MAGGRVSDQSNGCRMIIAPGLHVEAILSPLARLNKKISPIAVRLTRADAAPGSTWTKNRAASLAQLPCPSSTCAVRGCTARAASAVPSSADRGLQVWDGVGLTLSLSVAWRSGSASCVRIRLPVAAMRVRPSVVTKLKCRVFRHLEMSLPVRMGAEPAPARSLD